MAEVQSHGFTFEKWVRDHFFGGYAGSYMQKWDVFRADLWNQLWGQLSLEQLRTIDAIVKDMGEHYSSVRQRAKSWKAQPVVQQCNIVINPKIDSKTQRRIQCSLPVETFWKLASRDSIRRAEEARLGLL